MIVKLLCYCKNGWSYDTFKLLGVNKLNAEKTDVKVLYNFLEHRLLIMTPNGIYIIQFVRVDIILYTSTPP